MKALFEVSGTYGSHKTPTTVLCYENVSDGGTWYVCEGGTVVNYTYDEVEDGVNVEELRDADCFTAGSPIETLEELESAVDD